MPQKKSVHSTADLARHLGLSRWSVSRAINGQSGVSPATAEQVRTAMAEFGFAPSAHARGLRGHRTGAVGICFRALDTPVTIAKIAQVQRLLSARGYRPLFEMTDIDDRRGGEVISHFVSLRVEGVILVDTPPTAECAEWLETLRRHRIPAVLLEPRGAEVHNTIRLDRELALNHITTHLLALGHRKFGLLGISRHFPLGKVRYEGIARAFAAHDLAIGRQAIIFDVPSHRHSGLRYGTELAEQLLSQRERPTALIALNDDVAAAAMWRLQRAGIEFPADCSIFGFDNLMLAEQTNPPLASVDHNVDALAETAVEMLFTLIAARAEQALPPRRIEPRLILRESVAAPRGAAKPRA